MEGLLAFAFLGGVLALTLYAIQAHRRSLGAALDETAGLLEEGQASYRQGFLVDPLVGAFVSGKVNGRRVQLSFREEGSGKSRRVFLCFSVDVSHPPGRFRVEPLGVLKRVGRFLGLVADTPIGNARIDDKYVLSGSQGSLQELFRQAPQLETLFDELFGRRGLRFVELLPSAFETGRVRGEAQFGGGLSPTETSSILSDLSRVASYCERRPAPEVPIKVLGERPALVWTAGGRGARCPYCRDDLEPSQGAACEACGTLHHAECLREAGGCTVFGCAGSGRSGRQRLR